MKDNKLIADFMGYTPHPEDERFLENKNEFGKGIIDTEEGMAYHTSWDWLMPVVQKCRSDDQNLVGIDNWSEICLVLEECNLHDTYQAVVEFINGYNVQLEKDIKNGLYGEQ